MKRIRSLDIFDGSFKNNGKAKSVMIVTVDGGSDENPRYILFKSGLRCIFLATNAPGRSAFNRVELRMLVKFNKELSGVVLPHDNFGSHLNAKGETIDKELEKKLRISMAIQFWLSSLVKRLIKKKLRNLKNGRVNTFANHNFFTNRLQFSC